MKQQTHSVLLTDPSSYDGCTIRPTEIIQKEAKEFLIKRKERIMSNKDRSKPRPTPIPSEGWDG
jgi:predicted metal-dependent TIM-barrel fold hydrolase